MQRVSKTDHDIMIFRVVPRHSSCCLVRPAFFSFLWQGWLGCRCPPPAIQKYPQSSACEAEGCYGTFSDAWYHDIRHCIMLLDIQWYSSIFSELSRQTMTSWFFMAFHDIPRYSTIFSVFQHIQWVFLDIPWYSSTCSQLPRPWHHDIPSDSTMLLDILWYSSICKRPSKADHGIMIFHDISRYSVILKYTQRAANTYHVVCVTGITVEAILRDLTAIRR